MEFSRAALLLFLALAACVPGRRQPEAPPSPPPQADVPAPPAAPPAWEVRGVAPDAQTISATTYTVLAGDTLRRIAEKTGAGSEIIAHANGLEAPFVIHPGQRLAIPAGRYHLVRSGQSGIAIARAYQVPWEEIVRLNALQAPYILRTGQRILLPGATEVARRSRAERAAAFSLDIDDILTGGEPALPDRVAATPPTLNPARAQALPSTAAIAEPAALAGGFAWPARGPILSRFGPVASGERNEGIKIGMPPDTPVKAAADGVVIYAGDSVPGLGGLVLVKHGGGWVTAYGHASRIEVTRGQAIRRGQEIARSGQTGRAAEPQLHFEMRKGRTPVDPLGTLPRG